MLPPFSVFIAKFPNEFSCHHAPKAVNESLCWWDAILAKSDCSQSLKPHQHIDPDLWVNASTSWGIGIIYSSLWYAWALTPGWKVDGRDIGWAKSMVLELTVLILIDQNFQDCSIVICSDNTGIISTYHKGRSRNIPHNNTICRITSCSIPNNITIIPTYVESLLNRADPISRSILGLPHLCVVSPPALPLELLGLLWNI